MNLTAEKVAEGLAGLLRDAFGRTGEARVLVAPDPATGLELLAAGKPGGFSVVVFYDSDAPNDPGTVDFDGIVDAELTVGVAAHPGLSAQETRKAPAVLAFAGRVRAAVCGAEPEGVLDGYVYRGMQQVRAVDGTLMRGYALRFGATYAFGEPETGAGGDAQAAG